MRDSSRIIDFLPDIGMLDAVKWRCGMNFLELFISHPLFVIDNAIVVILGFGGAIMAACEKVVIHGDRGEETVSFGRYFLIVWAIESVITALVLLWKGTDWMPFFNPDAKSVFSDGVLARGISDRDALLSTIGVCIDIFHFLIIRIWEASLVVGIFLVPIMAVVEAVHWCRRGPVRM